jgi:hypothetical protein
LNAVYSASISGGVVGTWTLGTNAYPTNIAEQSCVAYSGYIYCVGGWTGIPTTAAVYSASLSNGVVGTWTLSTNPYPTNIAEQSCVAHSGYIYCVGGWTGIASSAAVYYASVGRGRVGTWTSTTAYPTIIGVTAGIDSESCVTYSEYLYCVGGTTGAGFITNAVYSVVTDLSVGDYIVWRPSDGVWYVQHPDGSTWRIGWGTSGDIPLLGNFSNNGLKDFVIWRPSNGYWYILQSSSGYNPATATAIQWGTSGDVPLVGDVDGDGRADLCVWRPGNGVFFCLLSTQNYESTKAIAKQWGSGTLGDKPFIADMDKDGKGDFVVWRPGRRCIWFMLLSSNNYNPSQGKWVQWGKSTDTPLAATGAVCAWRDGVWFVLQGPDFTSAQKWDWGTTGDIPLFSR